MRRILKSAMTIPMAAAFLAFSSPVTAEDTGTLTQLQVIMQRYIDAQLVEGALRGVDFESGETIKYYPTEAHSMIMSFGDDFVLCTDLATEDGSAVPVDIYMTPVGDSYLVYQTEIDNRAPLQSLIKQKLVSRVK